MTDRCYCDECRAERERTLTAPWRLRALRPMFSPAAVDRDAAAGDTSRLPDLSTVPPPPSDLATKEAPVRRAGQRRGRNRKEVYRMSKSKYQSDVILGDKYRDPLTGFEGVATAATFYLHACERVTLEWAKDGEIKYESFDAPRLIHVATETQPQTTRTGGPGGREARPNRVAVR